MQVQVGSVSPSNHSTDLAVVAFYGRGGRRSPAWTALNRAIGGGLATTLEALGFRGKGGEAVTMAAPAGVRAKVLLVASLGERSKPHPGALRDVAIRAGMAARKGSLSRAAFWTDASMDARTPFDRASAQAIGEGLEYGAYRFDRHQAKKIGEGAPTDVYVYFDGRKERPRIAADVARGATIGRNQNIARDLGNEPANVLNPESLVDFARTMAADKGIEITVLDRDECEARGMGAFLSVAQASKYAPAFVHMVHRPSKPRKRVVLVGKALTYDSGGMCLKPAAGQELMKMDMCGSAAVIGAIGAAADLDVDVEVHAIFASCENVMGGSAYHTGDILTASNGKTIEVLNTDAEGRLTLADALVYACAETKPDLLIDLATLTGACMVALGPSIAGVMGTGRGLIRDLKSAAESSGEPLWELPMPEQYAELLQSKVADTTNLGGRYGGAITAGMFLKEFVDDGVAWAHIDIAGPAINDKPLGGMPAGATGFGVRVLSELIAFG